MEWKIAKSLVNELLLSAGITINGNDPWDIQVHHNEFYPRVLHQGALGLGESYMDKQWDCPALDQLFERIIPYPFEQHLKSSKRLIFKYLFSKIMNRKTHTLSTEETPLDLNNKLFHNMLDSRMIYTSGFWQNAYNLEHAQLHKLNLACQKLLLKPGMRILDIDCGWGGFAKYAAENFGVEVVGITASEQHFEYATEICRQLPVDIRLQNFQTLDEKFDRIVSLGSFENIGHANYHAYMQVIENCLDDDGIFLLHTIGSNTSEMCIDDWTAKYISSNTTLPSIAQIGTSVENLFVMEDWHNFGADYDKTLMAWHSNFVRNWDSLKSKYNERFFRMWNYYLLSKAGAFRSRNLQLWQIVLTKTGIKGGYPVMRPYFLTEKVSQNFARNRYSTPRSLHRFESLV